MEKKNDFRGDLTDVLAKKEALNATNDEVHGYRETARTVVHETANNQCCRFSRNIAKVTPTINYFYYQKINLLGQSIQKNNNLILEKNVTANNTQ